MPERYEQVGALVRRGVLLFSGLVPIPAATLIAAVGAAIVSRMMELHSARVTAVLSEELSLTHISYAEPDDSDLVRFYSSNPIFPELASEFQAEIGNNNVADLRNHYPYLYAALILKREIPALVFHQEILKKEYRKLAREYETLSRGFRRIDGTVELKTRVNQFATDLLQVIDAVYRAVEDEMKTKENQLSFEIIDYIRDVATT